MTEQENNGEEPQESEGDEEQQSEGEAAQQRLEPTFDGMLADVPLAKVLAKLQLRRTGGMLRIETPQLNADLYFHKGRVARILENPVRPEYKLGAVLVGSEKAAAGQIQAALKEAAAKKLLLGQALMAMQLLDKHDLAAGLQRQLMQRLVSLAGLKDGRFAYYDGYPLGKAPVSPPVYPLVPLFRHGVKVLGRRLEEQMAEVEAPNAQDYVFPSETAPRNMAEVGLDERQQGLWQEAVTGGFRLSEIYPVSKLSRRFTHGMLFTLVEFGFITFSAKVERTHELRELRKAIEKRYRLLGRATHFDAVGAHWTATTEDVEKAWQTTRNEYSPKALPPDTPEDLRQMAETILERAEAGYNAVVDADARRRYREEALDPKQTELAAELLTEQGEMAMARNDFKAAYDRYSHALEMRPSSLAIKSKLKEARARGGIKSKES